ncbi:MAG: nucleotide pyrophosphohydrolase [Anaerolineae bacterium]|nr:nucleotide pyrophosphohydrolase [Anaerolineae bacterium]
MTNAPNASLTAIQAAVRQFRDERNWGQFHSPKNLSMSIAIEAAELMEHFQWLSTEEAAYLAQNNDQSRQAIAEELADVLIYCFSLADILAYDVGEIILAKLAKNEAKYPAERFQGRF